MANIINELAEKVEAITQSAGTSLRNKKTKNVVRMQDVVGKDLTEYEVVTVDAEDIKKQISQLLFGEDKVGNPDLKNLLYLLETAAKLNTNASLAYKSYGKKLVDYNK